MDTAKLLIRQSWLKVNTERLQGLLPVQVDGCRSQRAAHAQEQIVVGQGLGDLEQT